jgi:dipeptidyl aminopeptidase/acylaminoacyl peptidase
MKRDLERIEIPGEHDARARTWRTVQAAFADRERVTWPRRHARQLALAAAGVAVVAAAVSPPGRSVVNSLRDAVGREKVVGVRPAHRELVRLPAAGRLLVASPGGTWVFSGSSRRRLGPYRMPSWSPHGKYVVAVKDFELYALDPTAKGHVRWSKGFKRPVSSPRWSYEGFRIAYLAYDTLRISTGDGVQDWSLGNADSAVAPAWRPQTHEVAYAGPGGDVLVADADAKLTLWRAPAGPDGVRALEWSDDGKLLLVRGSSSVSVLRADGSLVGNVPTVGPTHAAAWAPGAHRFALVVAQMVVLVDGNNLRFSNRALFTGTTQLGGLAWSPDGRWLLVAWPRADQFVFIRVGVKPKLVAVSNVARQFDPGVQLPRFPSVAGWSR